ncbi:MAG: 3'-5' exonuclease [Planctomycetaceae bacterium]|nr:3'-5' exonuclease [Planctomycetaceae bacterium]
MSSAKVKYFVFDVESVADGELVSQVRFPDESLSSQEAVQRYREQLIEERNSDFIPYTFQIPISVVIAKVTEDFEIDDIVLLDEPEFRPHVIAEHFWRGWERYDAPTFVSFNGRSFDIPLMELAAYRYGVGVPKWFTQNARSWEQPRNRYNTDAHLDLQDLLCNFGATRFNGGLNLAAHLLGKPGKMDVQGHMVQDMYDRGELDRINDYCRCDVLDTYFVFLRGCVLTGRMSLEREQEIIATTKEWLSKNADGSPAYQQYLREWGDWQNPWHGRGS